jgi:hypothetical protein
MRSLRKSCKRKVTEAANERPRAGLAIALVLLCLGILGGCGAGNPPASDEVNGPLSAFQQDIASPVHQLTLHANEVIQLPVTIKNTGRELLASKGAAPVVVSYKWFEGGTMLPVEGERTLLPHALAPGESVPLELKVVAPPQAKPIVLKVTLVQEGVAWFFTRGAKPLEIPADVR